MAAMDTTPDVASAEATAAGAAPVPVSAAAEDTPAAAGEQVTFKVVYAKKTFPMTRSVDETVGDFKKHVEAETGVPAAAQKLMYKGLMGAPTKPELDSKTLKQSKIVKNAKVLLVGATAEEVLKVVAVESDAKAGKITMEPEVEKEEKKKLCEMTEHKKILDKGVPDDAMVAWRPGQDPLPTEVPIVGFTAKGKVRLSFKTHEGTVIINTKDSTRKVQLKAIQDVRSEPIVGQEQYHILGLQLGPTERSTLYIYWFPAQYVSAIKGAVSGLLF